MLIIRPRRNRKTKAIRHMLEETSLLSTDFVMPFFMIEGENKILEIPSLPGVFRYSLDYILKMAEMYHRKGIPSIALFPVIEPSLKDSQGSLALAKNNFIVRAVKILKREIPSLCLITDIALDPFTSHGHDGIIDSEGYVLNDRTVQILCKMSCILGAAGADMVAPSDMMDGRIKAIRTSLDQNHLFNVGILSYTAKYASSLYQPFREAIGSALQLGDKKNYQMNPANTKEAIRQALIDAQDGADILMVKPASFYLDIIKQLKDVVHLPICAYHVSGEYAMVMSADQNGWLDASQVFYEVLLSIKRAGANFIFSYAIPQILPFLSTKTF